jgi:hypothetical protein
MGKQDIINALYTFAHKRPGLEPGNYISDWRDVEGRRAYAAESRSITKDLREARVLLRQVELSGISADQLIDAARRAFSGRLSINQNDKGEVIIDYCTGQYWPTEYRRAVCAVLASALWYHRRDDVPAHVENKGQYLRNRFAKEYGRGLASRWFN